jgi:hypothetical protein
MDIVTRLRAVLHNDRSVELMNREAADEIEKLRKERDEARREVCQFRSTSYPHDMKEVYEIADSRGWDCFKEDGK